MKRIPASWSVVRMDRTPPKHDRFDKVSLRIATRGGVRHIRRFSAYLVPSGACWVVFFSSVAGEGHSFG